MYDSIPMKTLQGICGKEVASEGGGKKAERQTKQKGENGKRKKKAKSKKQKKPKEKNAKRKKAKKEKKSEKEKMGKEGSTFINVKQHYAVAMENGKKIDRNLREERKPWGRIYTL